MKNQTCRSAERSSLLSSTLLVLSLSAIIVGPSRASLTEGIFGDRVCKSLQMGSNPHYFDIVSDGVQNEEWTKPSPEEMRREHNRMETAKRRASGQAVVESYEDSKGEEVTIRKISKRESEYFYIKFEGSGQMRVI